MDSAIGTCCDDHERFDFSTLEMHVLNKVIVGGVNALYGVVNMFIVAICEVMIDWMVLLQFEESH